MKFFIFLLLLPFYATSQLKIYNSDLFDTTKQQMFLHVSNRIYVQATLKVDSINFGDKEGFLIDGNDFEIWPRKLGVDTLRLYSKGKLFHTTAFKVDLLPNPIVRIGNSLDTVMSVQQILNDPWLNIIFPK